MARRISAETFKDLLRDNEILEPDIIITKSLPLADVETEVVKKVEGKERMLKSIISTGAVDRGGDTVNPTGWKLKEFNKSGVILWAHDGGLPPIAKPIQTWTTRKAPKQLIGTAQFTPADLDHPLGKGFGHTIYRMYVEGFMKAVSAGFISKKWDWSEEKGREGGIDFKEQELFEYSAVPIPANQEALAAAKGVGISMDHLYNWCEYSLDTNDTLCLDEETLENYHAALKSLKETPKTLKPKASKEEEKKEVSNNNKNKEDEEDMKKPVTLKDLRDLCTKTESTLVDKIIEKLKTLDATMSLENLDRLKEEIKCFENKSEEEDTETENETLEEEKTLDTSDEIDLDGLSVEELKSTMEEIVQKNLKDF